MLGVSKGALNVRDPELAKVRMAPSHAGSAGRSKHPDGLVLQMAWLFRELRVGVGMQGAGFVTSQF